MVARRALGWTLTLAVIVAQPLLAQDHGGMLDVSGEWEVSVMGGVGVLELTVEGHSISGYMTLGDHDGVERDHRGRRGGLRSGWRTEREELGSAIARLASEFGGRGAAPPGRDVHGSAGRGR